MNFSNTLFTNHRYAILGLGKNGIAAAQRLLQMGAAIQIWDDQEQKRLAIPDVLKPYLAPFQTLASFDALILSPGIPHKPPHSHPVAILAQTETVPILSDAEILYQAVRKSGSKARFVTITGTNGKSTTTVLVAHILQESGIPVAAGGNLGPAALALPYLDDRGVYVLEMSSYMLERLDGFTADIACLLNITPDHLERHGDMQGYVMAKSHIFDHQDQNGLAVIGIEDSFCRDIANRLSLTSVPVIKIAGTPTTEADLWVEHHIIRNRQGEIANLNQAPYLPGEHNAQNAAAAAAITLRLGISRQQVRQGLASFPGLAHRQKPVATLDSVTFINDSKATNADAASKALTCYKELVWIAGGLAKTNGIQDLIPYFPRIKLALLIGKDADLLAECLKQHQVNHEIVGTLDRAVSLAFAFARQHHVPIVLLSPACASFDQFSSFEERGDRFIHLVQQLKSDSKGK